MATRPITRRPERGSPVRGGWHTTVGLLLCAAMVRGCAVPHAGNPARLAPPPAEEAATLPPLSSLWPAERPEAVPFAERLLQLSTQDEAPDGSAAITQDNEPPVNAAWSSMRMLLAAGPSQPGVTGRIFRSGVWRTWPGETGRIYRDTPQGVEPFLNFLTPRSRQPRGIRLPGSAWLSLQPNASFVSSRWIADVGEAELEVIRAAAASDETRRAKAAQRDSHRDHAASAADADADADATDANADAPAPQTGPESDAEREAKRELERREIARRQESMLREGIRLSLPDTAAATSPPPGLLIHLTGAQLTGYEFHATSKLLHAGWASIVMDSSTFVRWPNEAESIRASQRRRERLDELREASPEYQRLQADDMDHLERTGNVYFPEYAERYRALIEPLMAQAEAEIPEPPQPWSTVEDPAAARRMIVEAAGVAVSSLLADHAEAALAALDELEARDPRLVGVPVVVVGFSLGSMTAPAVAAAILDERPGQLAGLALVGSGGPLLDVAADTTFGKVLPPITEVYTPLDEAAREPLRRLYLAACPLDPVALAPRLRGVPVLHIHGDRDELVPTRDARRLNDALGGPQRVVVTGGHAVLFWKLSDLRDDIARWAENHARAVRERRAGASAHHGPITSEGITRRRDDDNDDATAFTP